MTKGKRTGVIYRCMLGAGVAAMLTMHAQAQTHQWSFPLEGAQEVAPVATPGTGWAVVTYDTGTRLLEWEVQYSDLLANSTNAHFHGPADFGVNAGVRVGMYDNTPATIITADIGVTAGSFVGYHTISEEFETELLAGLWYINIHSTQHTGGEIRGQVVPEPTALALLGLAGAALLLRRRV
jgi:hypothetical protein